MSALWLHSAAEPFGRLVRTRQTGDFVLRLSTRHFHHEAGLPPGAYRRLHTDAHS